MDDERLKEPSGMAPEDVASATECTGLMPALPESDAGDVARAALYGIHAARRARRRYRRK